MKTNLTILENEAVIGSKIWNKDKRLKEKWVPLKRVQDFKQELQERQKNFKPNDWVAVNNPHISINEILGEE